MLLVMTNIIQIDIDLKTNQPTFFCPVCGHGILTVDGNNSVKESPCPHVTFTWHSDADVMYAREDLAEAIDTANDPDAMSDDDMPPQIIHKALSIEQKALFQLELNETVSMPSWSTYAIGIDWQGVSK